MQGNARPKPYAVWISGSDPLYYIPPLYNIRGNSFRAVKDLLRDSRRKPDLHIEPAGAFTPGYLASWKYWKFSTDSALKLTEPKVHLPSGVSTVARLCVNVVPPITQPDACFSVHYSHRDVRC